MGTEWERVPVLTESDDEELRSELKGMLAHLPLLNPPNPGHKQPTKPPTLFMDDDTDDATDDGSIASDGNPGYGRSQDDLGPDPLLTDYREPSSLEVARIRILYNAQLRRSAELEAALKTVSSINHPRLCLRQEERYRPVLSGLVGL